MVIFQGSTTACTQLVLVQSNICSFFFRSDCLLFFREYFFLFFGSHSSDAREKREKYQDSWRFLERACVFPQEREYTSCMRTQHPARSPKGNPIAAADVSFACLLLCMHEDAAVTKTDEGWKRILGRRQNARRRDCYTWVEVQKFTSCYESTMPLLNHADNPPG